MFGKVGIRIGLDVSAQSLSAMAIFRQESTIQFQPAVTLAYTDFCEAADTNRPTATMDRRVSNRLSGRRDGTGQYGSSLSC
jgi:hypothetical protein